MTTIRICDACGKELKSWPCVSVEVRLNWADKSVLDFHAEEECLYDLPATVKRLIQEGESCV